MAGAPLLRTVACVVVGVLVGGPVAATACEVRCHAQVAPGPEGTVAVATPTPTVIDAHGPHHHQHAARDERRVPTRPGADRLRPSTPGGVAGDHETLLTAAGWTCCVASATVPPVRVAEASELKDDSSRALTMTSRMHPVAAVAGTSATRLRRPPRTTPVDRAPAVLRI